MKKLILLAVFLLLFSCTESTTEPAAPELQTDSYEAQIAGLNQWTCRNNMVEISGACMQWFCLYSTYPNQLSQLWEPYSSMSCPECGLPYSLTGDENGYCIECPGNCGHGFILNSTPSWEPDITMGIHGCREIMRMTASQCVIYFATEDEWPQSLSDIGWEHLKCPACGEGYNYSAVSGTSMLNIDFFLSCPANPSHGYVQNGMSSW